MVEIDEYLAARERPAGRALMRMSWRHLLFMHYSLEPSVVQALLPPELTVDTFVDAQGVERAWIGVVPFTMHGIRPSIGPAVPWLSAFHETNVRTYVHHRGKMPGVWFFSLDAARFLACRFANMSYGLPYHHATMSMSVDGDRIRYQSTRRTGPKPANLSLEYRIGEPIKVDPGSLEFWMVERYYLYALKRGTPPPSPLPTTRTIRGEGEGLVIGQVHHPPYPIQAARVIECSSSLTEVNGLPVRPWEHCCYSPGVDVEVFGVRRVAP